MSEPGATTHTPHASAIPASDSSVAELTARAVILGAVLGVIFAASSTYLALKIGLTVSASIPIAVLSITIFRAFGRATILENNIVQTTGSAGESLAAAIGFVLPALILMGYDLEVWQILLVALLGGVLGVLMMIPLRHGLIVAEHGKLPYPEGTACAEVLIVGEQGGTNAKTVFMGFGIGLLYKFASATLGFFKEAPERVLGAPLRGGSFGGEITPELLGVGYIIGPRIASTMLAGGVLGYLGLMPAIAMFGDGLTEPVFPSTGTLIRDMSSGQLRSNYVLYIGAGAVATGGIISLARALPTIASAIMGGWRSFQASRGGAKDATPRTDRDLPMPFVLFGSIALVIAMLVVPFGINWMSALLIILFGFLFTAVSSRITGEIGSSSNPISGMTVATILATCLLFLIIGRTGIEYRAMAIITGALVCVAASNGGTTSQDLKTGFLVGATPRSQQIAILVGVVTSALFIGLTMKALNDANTTVHARPNLGSETVSTITENRMKAPDGSSLRVAFQRESGQPVPQGKYLVDDAGLVRYLIDPGIGGTETKTDDGKDVKKLQSPKGQLYALIVDGILTQKLPWALVLVGVFISITMELCGVAALPFAVGLYLPISVSSPIAVGGFVRYLVDRKRKKDRDTDKAAGKAVDGAEGESDETSPGTLLSSGYIAGGAIAGLVGAFIASAEIDLRLMPFTLLNGFKESHAYRLFTQESSFLDIWSIAFFVALCAYLFVVGIVRSSGNPPAASPRGNAGPS